MPRNKPQRTMSDVLRDVINAALASGETYRSLEQKTGVVRQSLMPFSRGEQGLQLSKVDKLAEYFGLELRPVKASKREGK